MKYVYIYVYSYTHVRVYTFFCVLSVCECSEFGSDRGGTERLSPGARGDGALQLPRAHWIGPE